MITHLCRTCASPVKVARIDATTYISGPSFAWGRWDPCTGCGSTGQPMQVARIVLAVAILAALVAALTLAGLAAPASPAPTVTPSPYGWPTWKAPR